MTQMLKLERVIAWRLVEHELRAGYSMPYRHLLRWIRLQWPSVLPEAVAKKLCDLAQVGFIECDDRGWRIRPRAARPSAARQHRNGWRA